MTRAYDELVGRSLGDFVLRARIGEGGFGAVYRATQRTLDREAAIKVLHTRLNNSPAATERFLREARLASKLDHPYAAHIYAFGAEPDGQLWIAMEFVRGTPLDQVLKLQGPLPLERFVQLLDRICEVVHTAHEQGIVHRDLKPANVMVLARAGRLLPKLLDFGIAKGLAQPEFASGDTLRTDSAGSAEPVEFANTLNTPVVGLTQRGAVMGSPLYMAPEQWVDAGGVGPRTDLYALGILAYECLTGKPPFTGSSLTAIAVAHAEARPAPLGPQFPIALDRVFTKVLAKDAADRYPDALAVATAFRAASGIASEVASLPAIVPAVRDAAINEAPQPIAEAIAAFEAARNAHQARDALALVGRTITRYLGLLALACRSRVASDDGASEPLRVLTRRALTDTEWLALARTLTQPWLATRDAYPIPELVGAFHDGDAATDLEALAALRDEDPTEVVLERAVVRTTKLLERLTFLLDYPLVVTTAGNYAERWMGVRRTQRSTVQVRGKGLGAGVPALLDKDGAPVLALAPLFQVAAPTPGAPLDLFLFDGRDRRGAKLVALPAGFEQHDDGLWDWFRAQLTGSLDETEAHAAEEKPPYRGLTAFTAEDATNFLGREKLVDAFINRLKVQPLLAVIGRSGSGKSSFVQAGVIPALPVGWRALTIRPGPSPINALVARLEHFGFSLANDWKPDETAARSSGRLPLVGANMRDVLAANRDALGHMLRADAARRGPIVVIVDQLEEMFTLCADPDERRGFAEMLVASARSADDPIRIVFTLRDDFLVRTEQVAALRNRIGQGLQLLTVPAAEELLRIVIEPARRLGYELEAELASDMVKEVADQPGALALISFAASKLWELRDRQFKQLTRTAYKTLGGVGGALARHAELTLDGMLSEERALTREAFRHLVTTQNSRAVITRAELHQLLGSSTHADSVVEKLIAARLLVASENESGKETIEIIHEALLVAWPRLVDWRREDSEGARFREQLRVAAKQWNERGKTKGLLWRDDALADYTRWRARHPGPLTDVESAFASESLTEAARNRRTRALIVAGGFAALGVVVVVLLVANAQTTDANHRLHENLQQQWEARGQRTVLDGKPLEGLVALAHAGELGAQGRTHDFLIAEAVSATEGALLELPHGGEVRYPRFSHDDARVITGSLDKIARIWDARTGKLLIELPHRGAVARTAFAPDDATVLTASLDGYVRWWDAATGKELRHFKHGTEAWCALFSSDGKLALTAGNDDAVVLSDLATGTQLQRVHGDGAGIHTCAFAPDGTRFAAGDNSGVVWLWNARTGELEHRLAAANRGVHHLEFSPDGGRLLAAAYDPTVTVWDVATGTVVHQLVHGDAVYTASFSPDGQRILTGSLEHVAFVWDAASGAKLLSLVGHTAGVTSAMWSPDGKYIATGSEDRSTRLWSAETGRLLANWQRHGAYVFDVAFDHHSERVVSASNDKTAIIWAARPQQPTIELPTPPHAYWVACSRDGAKLAIASSDGIATLWDARTGARVGELGKRGDSQLVYVAFDSLGGQLTTVSTGGVVRLWELGHPEAPRREFRGPKATLESADWSSDDQMIVVGGDDGYIRVWDASTGGLRFERLVDGGRSVRSVAFAPDAKTLMTADGALIQTWDLSGNELSRIADDNQPVSVSFDPSGRRIMSRTVGSMVEIRDLATGAIVKLLGHSTAVTRTAWHPTGRLVATGALDGTARLWNAETGDELMMIDNVGHEVSVAFLADGRLLVAGDNGTTFILTLPEYHGTSGDFHHLLECRVPYEIQDEQIRPRQLVGCNEN